MRKNKQCLIAIILAMTVVSCTKPKAAINNSGETIEITEKLFISQVNDVYLNTNDYLGKTIKLEGIFKTEQYQERDEPYYFVVRYGPGCCGTDGNAGFEVAWTGDIKRPYPAPDSWVEAMGVLDVYEEDGQIGYLYLNLSSLTVLSKRGAEFVSQ